MTHDHETKVQGNRALGFLKSGPGVLMTAALGVWVGANIPLHDLPEQFEDIYVTLYRAMALPFLVLTVLHAIVSLRGDLQAHKPLGWRVLGLMPLAMVLCAGVAVAVSLAVCTLAHKAVSAGIGPLIAAFDKSDANYLEVTLAAETSPGPGFLARVLQDFVPENVFHALATANVGQMLIFFIIFSAAVLRLAPRQVASFLSLVDAARKPFFHMMEGMQILIPIAVFMYAVHAAHAVSAADLSALKLLFGVVAAASAAIFALAILLVALLTTTSPLAVASDIKASVLAGVLAMTEEAGLPEMLRRIRSHRPAEAQAQHIVASLGLAIGHFGMIAVLGSVLAYTLVLYQIPLTPGTLASVLALTIVSAVLISGLNGPGVLAAALAFCGAELGLPVEALAVLVIVIEPLLELLLIPVSIAVTHALVEGVTADGRGSISPESALVRPSWKSEGRL